MKKNLYYRRAGRPYAFPVDSMADVVISDEPQETGPCDGDWNEVEVDTEYPDMVDLSSGLSEPMMLADAYLIEGAIMRHLGLSLPRPDGVLEPWTAESLDHTGERAAESLCDAIEVVYGAAAANQQRILLSERLSERLSEDYLAVHSLW